MTADRIPAHEIADQLAERIEELCRELLPAGLRVGREWRVGSIGGEAGRGLGVVLVGDRRGLWLDRAPDEGGDALDLVRAVRGCTMAEAITWSVEWLGLDRHAIAPAPRAPRPAPAPTGRDAGALAIWKAARPIGGALAEAYLRGRAIAIPLPPSLRFAPALDYFDRGAISPMVLPCLVAAIQAPDRRIVAIQRIYINPRGAGKAQVTTPKKSLGCFHGGAVRLAPAGGNFGLAEGVEDALSAMQLAEVPCWAVAGTRLHSVLLPDAVREVHLFSDTDAPGGPPQRRPPRRTRGKGDGC